MPVIMRPYAGENDKQAVLELRRVCTTPENVTDFPSLTDLHELLNPLRNEQHKYIRLWEDENGQLLAYGNVLLPYCNLSFLVHPAWWQTNILGEMIEYASEMVRSVGKSGHWMLTAGIAMSSGCEFCWMRDLCDRLRRRLCWCVRCMGLLRSLNYLQVSGCVT